MFLSSPHPLIHTLHYTSLTCTWDAEKEGKELLIAKETQKLNWKLNTSPSSVDDKDALKKPLTAPPVKKIDLRFPTGLEVTARNLKGVTIKDALDAIHKQMKKKVRRSLFPCPSPPSTLALASILHIRAPDRSFGCSRRRWGQLNTDLGCLGDG